ncbi:ABC transporter ATP-binding protein [Mycobacterium deserti]|uniref:ABC transporter ATP-binding protein n=1 Tax=Mycobacterium deserti TaxID=2978347 RepID=A0ABT2M827_9MYCO|nr:ABC transporter ATP-binding protein [Mycobacterium deserti]MCT7658417.1 ABC transporter ATP-binding protein [Mycobacterium deserti]
MTVTDTLTDTVVVVEGLRKKFGDNVILNGLDLLIRAGEFVALLGRSGSGKSTFLRALGALDSDVDGYLRVPERRAIVFQDPRLLPWQRVLTNVTVGLPSTTAVRRQALAALSEVNLAAKAKVWPRTLSGGEAQRVALARALVREPELLLLDEPFGALDALTRIKMHALLQDLCRRHTPAVLLVTHDVDEAILLADRIVVLTDGIFSLDVEVTVPKPRRRETVEFATLRTRLLAELGVIDGPHI